jgi:hypothetical protein
LDFQSAVTLFSTVDDANMPSCDDSVELGTEYHNLSSLQADISGLAAAVLDFQSAVTLFSTVDDANMPSTWGPEKHGYSRWNLVAI